MLTILDTMWYGFGFDIYELAILIKCYYKSYIQKDRKVMSKLPDWEFFVISRFFQGKEQWKQLA